MIFHENRLLPDSQEISYLIFFKNRKDDAKFAACCSRDWRFKGPLKIMRHLFIGHILLTLTILNRDISCFDLVGLLLYIPVNSYGHVRTVSSPNHTFLVG